MFWTNFGCYLCCSTILKYDWNPQKTLFVFGSYRKLQVSVRKSQFSQIIHCHSFSFPNSPTKLALNLQLILTADVFISISKVLLQHKGAVSCLGNNLWVLLSEDYLPADGPSGPNLDQSHKIIYLHIDFSQLQLKINTVFMKQRPRFPALQKIGNANPIVQTFPAMLEHLSLSLRRPKSGTLLFG